MKGKNKGKKFFNNGKVTVFACSCPAGFKPGMLRKKSGKRWWTNGQVQVFALQCPEGFRRGKLKRKKKTG